MLKNQETSRAERLCTDPRDRYAPPALRITKIGVERGFQATVGGNVEAGQFEEGEELDFGGSAPARNGY